MMGKAFFDEEDFAVEPTRSVGGTEGPRVVYTYDNANRLTSIVRTINGADPKVATTLSYDNADRLTTIAHGKIAPNPTPPPSGYIYTPLATLVYSYDSGGRLKTENNAEGLDTYSYDDTNQLTGVDRPVGQTDESFGYDANGNRNTSGYTVTTGNRITSGCGYTFTYDAEGNTTSKTQLNGAGTGDDVVTTFSYDYRNRLTGATEKTGGTLTMRANYTYDALGRRIKTDVDADGAGGAAAVVTWHLHDDQNTYANFNSGGSLTKRYLFGLAVDELLARTAANGGTAEWYLTDRLGSVRDIANASGTSVYHTGYDAFGAKLAESGGGGDRWGFTGREHDAETGNRYHRARYVDLVLDRWMCNDPIGFEAGDVNLYRYVGNAPASATDPSGMLGEYPPLITVGSRHTFHITQLKAL